MLSSLTGDYRVKYKVDPMPLKVMEEYEASNLNS